MTRINGDAGSASGRAERGAKALPVEPRARIGLAAGRDVAVAREIERSVAREELLRELREPRVLRLRERHVVGSFELDADREIVAAAASLPRRLARVPGAPVAIDVLRDGSVAADE